MREVLPSGPNRDNRTELSGPFEAGWEFAKRNPTVTGFLVGTAAPGVGNITGAIAGYVASRFYGPFKVAMIEASATHHERAANKWTEMGNLSKAEKSNQKAEKFRQRLASM